MQRGVDITGLELDFIGLYNYIPSTHYIHIYDNNQRRDTNIDDDSYEYPAQNNYGLVMEEIKEANQFEANQFNEPSNDPNIIMEVETNSTLLMFWGVPANQNDQPTPTCSSTRANRLLSRYIPSYT